jgi:xylan 1,4-beta-xylosidase
VDRTTATIRVDCEDWRGPLRRIWASIGYDEINWTYTNRGKALYRTLHDLAEVPYDVRNHNTLTSGNGGSEPARGSTNVYNEQPDGAVVYDWALLDRVHDVIVGAGFRPFVELGFLPRDLVPVEIPGADWHRDVGRETYEVDGLWKHPPRDLDRWAALVEALVRHSVERYGRDEVERWHFEVWNEPDLPNYWRGSFEDYCRLYDYAVAGATRALPSVRIGGPATTGPGSDPARAYLRRFLEHCVSGKNAVTGATGTRLDFVSFHTKGAHYSRRRVYGRHRPVERECPSSASMLRDIRAGLETVAEFPALAGRPVFVDECDPAVGTIYGVHDNPNFIVTNTEHYPTFLCALVKRVLDLDEAFERRIAKITTWAFYLEGKRFFEGNRALVTREDVEKPILNALRMLARLGDVRLGLTSTHARDVLAAGAPATEVDALAARSGEAITVLCWHQADEWWMEGEITVRMEIAAVPWSGMVELSHWRIDAAHSNAYAEWVRLGRPEDPGPAQLERLRRRQGLELVGPPRRLRVGADGQVTVTFPLPLFGTSLIRLGPTSPMPPGPVEGAASGRRRRSSQRAPRRTRGTRRARP